MMSVLVAEIFRRHSEMEKEQQDKQRSYKVFYHLFDKVCCKIVNAYSYLDAQDAFMSKHLNSIADIQEITN